MKRTRAQARTSSQTSDGEEIRTKVPRTLGADDEASVSLLSPEEPAEPASTVCFIDSLPNHLVIEIFRRLALEEVAFVLPQVCKRWYGLTTSEEMWSFAHLWYEPFMSDEKKKIFYKCMKMAPKIASLSVELDWWCMTPFSNKISVKSPGEIRILHFTYDNMPPTVMFFLLKKHKDSIEKLIITDTMTPYDDSDVRKLWNHIQNCSKLKHLVVDGSALFYCKASFRKNALCWKTLQILDVQDCGYEDMNTVQRLISMNPNWTEVYLATPEPKLFRGEVKALAKCFHLDTVQVPFCKEIKLLDSCMKIDSLIIECLQVTTKEISGIALSFSKISMFPNLKAVKMLNGSSDYLVLLRSFLQYCPGINLLNLVSMEGLADELREALKHAQRVEKIFFHEMSSDCVLIVKEQGKELLPNLKEVTFSNCHCHESFQFCVKCAIEELQVQHPALDVKASGASCKCKEVCAPSENEAVSNKSEDDGDTGKGEGISNDDEQMEPIQGEGGSKQ